MKHKSFALISTVLIVTIISIVVLGLSFFIIETHRKLITTEHNLKSIYAAETGAHKTVYDYTKNNQLILGQQNIAGSESYEISATDAGVLMVDTSKSKSKIRVHIKKMGIYFAEIETSLSNLISNDREVVIDRLKVTWFDDTGLFRVKIRNQNVWGGLVEQSDSPAEIDINDTAIGNGNYTLELSFVFILGVSDPFLDQPVSVEFFMTDGSSKMIQIYPKGVGSTAQNNFTFRSTGISSSGSVSVQNTVEVNYNTKQNLVSDYKLLP